MSIEIVHLSDRTPAECYVYQRVATWVIYKGEIPIAPSNPLIFFSKSLSTLFIIVLCFPQAATAQTDAAQQLTAPQ